jgi:ABC-type transporter MlaC component
MSKFCNFSILALLVSCLANSALGDLSSAEAFSEAIVDEVNAILADKELGDNKQSVLKELVLNNVDIQMMGRIAILDQRELFSDEQQALLVQNVGLVVVDYLVAELTKFDKERIKIVEVSPVEGSRNYILNTLGRTKSFFRFGRDRARTNYRLTQMEKEWKITAIRINGVDIAQNYRSQINALVQRGDSAEKIVEASSYWEEPK